MVADQPVLAETMHAAKRPCQRAPTTRAPGGARRAGAGAWPTSCTPRRSRRRSTRCRRSPDRRRLPLSADAGRQDRPRRRRRDARDLPRGSARGASAMPSRRWPRWCRRRRLGEMTTRAPCLPHPQGQLAHGRPGGLRRRRVGLRAALQRAPGRARSRPTASLLALTTEVLAYLGDWVEAIGARRDGGHDAARRAGRRRCLRHQRPARARWRCRARRIALQRARAAGAARWPRARAAAAGSVTHAAGRRRRCRCSTCCPTCRAPTTLELRPAAVAIQPIDKLLGADEEVALRARPRRGRCAAGGAASAALQALAAPEPRADAPSPDAVSADDVARHRRCRLRPSWSRRVPRGAADPRRPSRMAEEQSRTRAEPSPSRSR